MEKQRTTRSMHTPAVAGGVLLLALMAMSVTLSWSPAAQAQQSKSAKAKKGYRLPEELLSSDPAVRKAAVIKAVKDMDTKAMGKLASMARKDPAPQVRVAATWAVGEMDLKMRRSLLKKIEGSDSSAEVREEAKKALAKLEEYGDGKTPAGKPSPQNNTTGDQNLPRTESGEPWGYCLKDTDCKGKRICTEPIKPNEGWAKPAGVFGIFGSGAVAGLTIAAALNKEEVVPAVPLAAGGTAVTVITAAVISAGSKSARKPSEVDGSIGLRIVGWLSFGFHITGSAALAVAVPFHWINEDEEGNGWSPPISWILVNGGLGTLALICLSADSFISAKQARDKRAQSTRKDGKVPRVSWAPSLGAGPSPNGGRSLSIGFSGSFM